MPKSHDLALEALRVNNLIRLGTWLALNDAWVLCGYFSTLIPMTDKVVKRVLSTEVVWC